MVRPVEMVQTLNSLVRTLLGLVVVGGIGTAGFVGYQSFHAGEREEEQRAQELRLAAQRLAATEETVRQQQEELQQKAVRLQEQQAEISQLNVAVAEQQVEIDRLETSLRLHKMQRRLARVEVLKVEKDGADGRTWSQVRFVELDDVGDPVGEAKEFRLEGDVIYIDYRVVKFEDSYVEQADLERGTSICMFHRIFGEHQQPREGFTLDEPGSRPGNYARGSVMSDFESKIWSDFWQIANDPAQASAMGIRNIQGDAVSIKVAEGSTYRLTVRASGGPEIEREPSP